MNITSEDIKDIIESDSDLGLEFGTDIFIGQEPANPINTITIFDTNGYPPKDGLTDLGYECPSVQIRIRNDNYKDAAEMAQNIKTLLHGRANETWNNTRYIIIQVASGPAFLDWDNGEHARFIINFNIQREAV
jgi:hypothetical protein